LQGRCALILEGHHGLHGRHRFYFARSSWPLYCKVILGFISKVILGFISKVILGFISKVVLAFIFQGHQGLYIVTFILQGRRGLYFARSARPLFCEVVRTYIL
jgi:negative regulator of replication initiation